MKKLLLGLVLVSTSAFCEPIASLTNQAGGKIVLTNEKCDIAGYKLAYATHPDISTQFGCWTADSVTIHIRWSDGEMRAYDYSNWVMLKKGKNGNSANTF